MYMRGSADENITPSEELQSRETRGIEGPAARKGFSENPTIYRNLSILVKKGSNSTHDPTPWHCSPNTHKKILIPLGITHNGR
jgi:hypothetical protein